MSIARTAATWLLTQIRKELTIQKPPPDWAQKYVKTKHENKSFKTGLNGFAMLLLITLAMAALVL